MTTLPARTDRVAAPLLRASLGLILLWIGALKFHDPSAVVGLFQKSVSSALASTVFVHGLGMLEIVVAVLLLGNIAPRYVALLSLLLFSGTPIIFFTTSAVTGFPYLTLAGRSLLKCVVLAATLIMVAATDATNQAAAHATPTTTRTHANVA